MYELLSTQRNIKYFDIHKIIINILKRMKILFKIIYLDELIMFICALDVTANIIECKYYHWLFKLRFESKLF